MFFNLLTALSAAACLLMIASHNNFVPSAGLAYTTGDRNCYFAVAA
jgi:hypothetical protein